MKYVNIAFIIGMLIWIVVHLSSCTLSFQNIDTHGTATDLVDENQATSPNVSPTVNVTPSAIH